MNWFVWRQHRKQFLLSGIFLVLYAALAIPMGLHFWHTYQHALATCGQINSCNQLSSQILQSGWDMNLNPALPSGGFNFMSMLILSLPLILGIFWGAPLLAREYTENTNKLVWTQSIARRKWLTITLVWMLLATIIFATIFTIITTWWSKTGNALSLNRFSTSNFAMQGIVPIAYALFAVAVGIAAGAWTRRIMAAAGTTLAIFAGVGFIAIPSFIRPHYMTPVTVTSSIGAQTLDNKIPASSWILSHNIVGKNGKTFDSFAPSNVPVQCRQIIQQEQVNSTDGTHVKAPAPDNALDICLNKAGYHQVAKYQPFSRYWDFQRIEAGIYLGLSALAVGTTYWLVLKRDA
jgi:ABC-type transport system involved in multi-copper enzyme maturation permease subunit